jgi:hypothetical protein
MWGAKVDTSRFRRLRSAASAALVVGMTVVVSPGVAAAADPCIAPANPIVCENSKPGSPPSEWDVVGAGDEEIQGFATDIGVNIGQQISFKIDTDASAYTIDIYRLGWYGGNGARKIATITPSAALPQHQPACITDPSTEIYDCGNWAVSASWIVPPTAVSGVYVAQLTHPDPGDKSHIPFIVRDDSSHSALIYQTSDPTWQAYNTYGGSDFYEGLGNGRAYKISYNRPFATRGDNEGRDFLFSNEYPMIRFLEHNGYDVTYTSGVDSDRRGSLLLNHRVFLSVGHDEYWSGPQRANVEAARDAGVNLAFFSGNEVYWRTRWEPSEDGSDTAYRTLVCYKETWANADIDPSPEWTGTYRDPRFTPPNVGGDNPENALTGTAYLANHDDLAIRVPPAQGKFRLWRNTAVATQAGAGQTATLAPHTVGYESDEDLDNGFRPGGLIRLSTTTGSSPQMLQDFGNTVLPGNTTHHLTLYRAASGALVFGAGTIQYAWGLDEDHDGTQSPADPSMQQATVNILADMGAQPATLMGSLVAATASTDTTAPTTTISSPAAETTITRGSPVTLQGTAADVGGLVASVEVSTDGGATWHMATGTTSWSYTFTAAGPDSFTVLVRGIDDSANVGQAPASRQFTLTGPHSLFGSATPANPATSDSSGIELGVRVTPQTDGVINGIRFYKGTGNTGTHTGTLWSNTGVQLATGTFTTETGSGWQTLTFGSPVPVAANTTYLASYYAPSGHYAADTYAFSYTDFVAGLLAAPRSVVNARNGVYRYGGGFPDQSYEDTNYYVDVVFTSAQDTAPTVSAVAPPAGSNGVSVSVHPTATFSKAMDAATIQMSMTDSQGGAVAGAAGYDSTAKTATFTPSADLSATQTYTVAVDGSDTQGHPMSSPMTWSFTTDLDPSVETLFATSSVPADTAVDDSGAVELGVRFVPSVSGTVTGVRFYQGPGNTGTHTGSLWTPSGTLLARVTFPSSSTDGWQVATFSTPVSVSAGTSYVVSYFAPNGHYAADTNFFASAWTNGDLTAPAGGNGLYHYSATGGFPNDTYQSTNYWVEPLFMAGGSQPPPADRLFLPEDTPEYPNWPEAQALELGVTFSSDTDGTISGVRFYKGTQNTGVHTGSLWTVGGQLLATGTFQNETASGWQTLLFSQPVAITAGTQYVASYHTSVGYYAATPNAFNGYGLDRPPLHVPASGGAYLYSGTGGFPGASSTHNFWVDVVFASAG